MSLVSVEAARERLLSGALPVKDCESLPLREAYGRVLAEDLPALRTQPPFDASAMDGYAVRAEDLVSKGAVLSVIGEVAAGGAFPGRIETGQAVRIFTGAPLPTGADAILIQENAELLSGSRISAAAAVEAKRHVRRAGVDFTAGETLIEAGTRLSAGAIALAASGGHPTLQVLRRPRVAIVASGDELVLPGEPVGPSQIVASNSFGVAAVAEDAGALVLDYGIVRDEEHAIGLLVDRAIHEKVDVLVTIGGASVGDHDLVGPVFLAKGVELDFWKVAMRPGKPLMAGRLNQMRILGLPGNPASSMVAAVLFLKPLIQALAGRHVQLRYSQGTLATPMPSNDHRAEFVRASVAATEDGTSLLTPLAKQDSSLLSVYAQANALLVRDPFAVAAEAGETCRFIPLDHA